MEADNQDLKSVRYIGLAFISLLVIALFFLNIKFNVVGLVVGDINKDKTETTTYIDNIGVYAEQSSEYQLILKNGCDLEICSVNNIRISGNINANSSGSTKIYLEDSSDRYLILEKAFQLGKIISVKNITSHENQTYINETTNETIVTTIEKVEEVNITIEEPEVFKFTDACSDTCDISKKLTGNSYKIIFEIDGNISISIDSLKYTLLNEKDKTKINSTETQSILNLTDNVSISNYSQTNISINSTGLNITINSSSLNINKIEFIGRTENKKLPQNWFIKSEFDVKDNDAGEWEWEPLKENQDGVLLIDTSKLLGHYQAWYETPMLRVFSKPVNNENGYSNISFDYKTDYTGDCVQFGMEVIFNDNTPDKTIMMNLNESKATSIYTDFNVESSNLGDGWVSINAQSIYPLQNNTKSYFYFAPLCDGGDIYIKNLEYGFISA